jgi:hypothetical protein
LEERDMKLLAAALSLPVLALTLLAPSLTHAQDQDTRWVKRSLRIQCQEDGTCYRRYYYQRRTAERERREYYAARRGTQVRGYTWRADDDDRDYRGCRDTKRVVGNQHLTVNGAKAEADKAWIQSIRFYYGEVFMSLENAKDVKYTCSRSSVGETLGQTFNRCEIEAKPCKAEKVESAESK